MKLLVAHAPPLLACELLSRGHDVVVAHYPWEFRQIPPGARHGTFISLPGGSKLAPKCIGLMRRLIETHRPDVVHAFSPRSLAHAVLATTWMRSPPALVSFRGITPVPTKLDPSNHVTFLSRRVARHACESHAVEAGLLGAGVPRSACVVVYNCVRRDALTPYDPAALRERLGIPRNAFVLGTIANVRPVKGVDVLLQAALECRHLANLHVVIIGGMKDRVVSRLCRDPRWQGRLHLAGFVPGAGGMATAFDVFAMASRREGLSRALLEAMCLGICPLVSDAGGMKELVRHEKDGLVVPAVNVPALAAAIRRLYANPGLIARLGQSAATRASSMCSPAAMADRVYACYRELVGGGAYRVAAAA